METIAESLFGTMEKVSFRRDNLTLAGHLFKPADFDDTKVYPTLIVGGAVTMVKEQAPDNYARLLVLHDFVVLTFDYASYGESEGYFETMKTSKANSKISKLVFPTCKHCLSSVRSACSEPVLQLGMPLIWLRTTTGSLRWLRSFPGCTSRHWPSQSGGKKSSPEMTRRQKTRGSVSRRLVNISPLRSSPTHRTLKDSC